MTRLQVLTEHDWQWHAPVGMPGTHNLVAVADGRTVGMARGVPVDEDTRELRSLWVSPVARGGSGT
ncbi:GNAT family N-acetyltransferase [Streptomyces sp. NPDC048172]|uniref:GNAT family N-acetyltransferase n=1 Tax=Streptomyces sp. NPDC048172 TaxID=3365505 RepID=UPI003716A201